MSTQDSPFDSLSAKTCDTANRVLHKFPSTIRQSFVHCVSFIGARLYLLCNYGIIDYKYYVTGMGNSI